MAGTLAIEADLDIAIDGRSAKLSGSGKRLTLELASAVMVRDLLRISLPQLGPDELTVREVPGLLVALGLTLDVRDRRGLLFSIGSEIAGKTVRVPFLGRLEHVELAGKGALLRLATSR